MVAINKSDSTGSGASLYKSIQELILNDINLNHEKYACFDSGSEHSSDD